LAQFRGQQVAMNVGQLSHLHLPKIDPPQLILRAPERRPERIASRR
jgi:hypothetical protein